MINSIILLRLELNAYTVSSWQGQTVSRTLEEQSTFQSVCCVAEADTAITVNDLDKASKL